MYWPLSVFAPGSMMDDFLQCKSVGLRLNFDFLHVMKVRWSEGC